MDTKCNLYHEDQHGRNLNLMTPSELLDSMLSYGNESNKEPIVAYLRVTEQNEAYLYFNFGTEVLVRESEIGKFGTYDPETKILTVHE